MTGTTESTQRKLSSESYPYKLLSGETGTSPGVQLADPLSRLAGAGVYLIH